jgi:hypothetical protein
MVGSIRDQRFEAVRYTLLEVSPSMRLLLLVINAVQRLKTGVDTAVVAFQPRNEAQKMADVMKQAIVQV